MTILVFDYPGRIDQTRGLFLVQHLRQVQNLLRVGCFGGALGLPQHLRVEEAQSGQTLRHRVLRQLPLAEHGCLILPNVLGA